MFQCQARKRVVEAVDGVTRPVPLGYVRCWHFEKHEDDHAVEYRGIEYRWPRGKQSVPFFVLKRKAA